MATPAQITANRVNAQRSTGPRSAEGKSVSRFNALKHGLDAESVILPDEDPAAYQAIVDAYAGAYHPENIIHRVLLDMMIRADWQKQRLQRLENDVIRTALAETPGATLAGVMLSNSPAAKLLARIQRQIAAHERSWLRAHAEFVRLAVVQTRAADAEDFQRALACVYLPEKSQTPERTQSAAPQAAKAWPPVDESTGQPRYFVG